jgi:hypothetical protein
MWRLYNEGIRLTTGFIGSKVSYTQLQCKHFTTSQFTIVLPESSYCVFTGCLSSNTAGFVRLQLCNSFLKTAARHEY